MSISVEEARAKMAEKFGDSTRMGGKGVPRRKVFYIRVLKIYLEYFFYFN